MARRLKSTLKHALVSTTAATALATGISPVAADEITPSIPDVQPAVSADNPVSGPDAEIFPQGDVVHMGGMHGMMKLDSNNIFHYLAAMPEEERVLRVGVLTQEAPPYFLERYNVEDSEYTPMSEEAIRRIEVMMEQFTAMTDIRTEVVRDDPSAMLLVGAFTGENKERLQKEQEKNPDILVREGFAAWPETLPDSGTRRGLLMLHQNQEGEISPSTAWHELGHFLGESHSADEHGTLGDWHADNGWETFPQFRAQQQSISMMAYGRDIDEPGPLDIYLIREAMKQAGLTPPQNYAVQTRLAAESPEEQTTAFVAHTIQAQPASRLEGTDKSDLLVTEAGLCGLTRYELYVNGQIYCLVEGDYADVLPGAGNDLILTSRLDEQKITLGEGENSVAILDKDSGDKIIRYDLQSDEGRNTLIFSDDMLRYGTVSARQEGNAVILDFLHEGVCTTRLTLANQLAEGQGPKVGTITAMFTVPDASMSLPVEIDISRASAPEDFEFLFNEQMDAYREQAETAIRQEFPSEEEFQRYLDGQPQSPNGYGEAVKHATEYWGAEQHGSPRTLLHVAFHPPEQQKDEERLPLTKPLGTAQAILPRKQEDKSWQERVNKDREVSASASLEPHPRPR